MIVDPQPRARRMQVTARRLSIVSVTPTPRRRLIRDVRQTTEISAEIERAWTTSEAQIHD